MLLGKICDNISPKAIVTTVVPTQPFDPRLSGLLPAAELNSVYHVIPGYSFEASKSINAWKFVAHVLQERLSSRIILDLGLPYYDDHTGITYRARYIFHDNSLHGIRIDTSPLPGHSRGWPRNLVRTRALPVNLHSLSPKRQFIVGEFSLTMTNARVGLLFGSEARRNQTWDQYLRHDFDILSITDESHEIDHTYLHSVVSEARKTNLAILYSNCQDLTLNQGSVGGAIVAQGEDYVYQQEVSLRPNPIISKRIDFKKRFGPDSGMMFTSWKQISRGIQDLNIAFLFSSNSVNSMEVEKPFFLKAVNQNKLILCKVLTLFRSFKNTPIVIEWSDSPKNLIVMQALLQISKFLAENYKPSELSGLLPQLSLRASVMSYSIILQNMLIVYRTKPLNHYAADKLPLLGQLKQALGSGYFMELEDSSTAAQIVSSTKRPGSNKYLTFTSDPKLVSCLRNMNQTNEGDACLYMCFDLFSEETHFRSIFRVVFADSQQQVLPILQEVLIKFFKNRVVEDQIEKYFLSLNLHQIVDPHSPSFDPIKFITFLQHRPNYDPEMDEEMYETFIPKLLCTPIQVQNPITRHFLYQTHEQIKLHEKVKPQFSQSDSAFQHLEIEECLALIQESDGLFKVCHNCHKAVPRQAGAACTNRLCYRYFCVKCLHLDFKRFQQVKSKGRLEDCPVCIKECRCFECIQKESLNKNSVKPIRKTKKVSFKEKCTQCKHDVSLNSSNRCCAEGCSKYFCLDCSGVKSVGTNWLCEKCRRPYQAIQEKPLPSICQIEPDEIILVDPLQPVRRAPERFRLFTEEYEQRKSQQLIAMMEVEKKSKQDTPPKDQSMLNQPSVSEKQALSQSKYPPSPPRQVQAIPNTQAVMEIESYALAREEGEVSEGRQNFNQQNTSQYANVQLTGESRPKSYELKVVHKFMPQIQERPLDEQCSAKSQIAQGQTNISDADNKPVAGQFSFKKDSHRQPSPPPQDVRANIFTHYPSAPVRVSPPGRLLMPHYPQKPHYDQPYPQQHSQQQPFHFSFHNNRNSSQTQSQPSPPKFFAAPIASNEMPRLLSRQERIRMNQQTVQTTRNVFENEQDIKAGSLALNFMPRRDVGRDRHHGHGYYNVPRSYPSSYGGPRRY